MSDRINRYRWLQDISKSVKFVSEAKQAWEDAPGEEMTPEEYREFLKVRAEHRNKKQLEVTDVTGDGVANTDDVEATNSAKIAGETLPRTTKFSWAHGNEIPVPRSHPAPTMNPNLPPNVLTAIANALLRAQKR